MRNNGVSRWIEKIEDPELKKHVIDVIRQCAEVHKMSISYNRSKAESDEVDLKGRKEDLQDTLLEIYETGDNESNPLWSTIMQIRPAAIGGFLNPRYIQAINDELWAVKQAAENNGNQEKAAFFGKLVSRLRYVSLFRAVISGGPCRERIDGKGSTLHFFPGISQRIRKEAGVRLTTRPDNTKAVIEAYKLMRDKTEGHARKAMEAHLEDIDYLFNRLGKKV